jgi:HSP20 family protein
MKDFEILFRRMQALMQRAMDYSYLNQFSGEYWQPSLDVYETSERVVVLVEISGVKPERINVAVKDEELIISGVRPDPTPEGAIACHVMEMQRGKFFRKVQLSSHVDKDNISASCKDGILVIELPKDEK